MDILGLLSRYFAKDDKGYARPVDPPKIEPLAAPVSPGRKRLATIIGTTAVAGLIAVTAQWEGKRNTPYQDIVGVWTVCYGETRVDMRKYSDEECEDMLAEGLADFAEPVLERNPELRGHDPQIIAATSLAYNIGPGPEDLRKCGKPKIRGGYRCSSVARNFSEGRWRSACDAIMRFNRAGGRPVQGLTNRRNAERKICLRGIPAEFNR